jgi:hypothetical protein
LHPSAASLPPISHTATLSFTTEVRKVIVDLGFPQALVSASYLHDGHFADISFSIRED